MQNPKVSVCVITYNHELYIEDCILSILGQVTDFSYEIIIGDDCSTDKTCSIVEGYRAEYPDIIKFISQNVRSFGALNYETVHAAAAGEYVAHVDGDDLLLPNKLQAQVNLFDTDPLITILWHRVVLFDGDTAVAHPCHSTSYLDTKISQADLVLYGPFGPHSSTMYRKKNYYLRNTFFVGNDWFISVQLIGDSYGLMMSDVLGYWRVTSSGISAGLSANYKNRLLLTRCQSEILRIYPSYSSLISLRALCVFIWDLFNLKSYAYLSLVVIFKSNSFPNLCKLRMLLNFFRSSRLPAIFS